MKDIIDGFLKFQKDAYPERVKLFKDLASQQSPRALFISCSDSRLVPELVTQREPGDLSSFAMQATSCRPTARAWRRIGFGRICRGGLAGFRHRHLRPLRLRRHDGHRHLQMPGPHARSGRLAALRRFRPSG